MYAGVNPGGAPVMVTVPRTVPGPHGADELLLELAELDELPALPELFEPGLLQHELELLDEDEEDTELTLELDPPLDPELMELPQEIAVGLSRRAARRCRPKAEAICGSTV